MLLAAGRGSRFDPSGRRSKLEQTLDGVPVAARALQSLSTACDRVVVVVRDEEGPLARALRRPETILAVVDGPQGMGYSIAAGARTIRAAFPDALCVLLMPADMPGVSPATVQLVAGSCADASGPIVVPTHEGVDGHPVGFPAGLLAELAACSGDVGARRLLSTHPVTRIPVADAGVVRDIDRPSDLDRWNLS
ncbi:MAG: NTP transferase domain-containing protein [Lautropia sp.]